MIELVENKLLRTFEGEKMLIEPWGADSLRVRITKEEAFSEDPHALLPPAPSKAKFTLMNSKAKTETNEANTVTIKTGDSAEIQNGALCLSLLPTGKMVFRNDTGKILLAEYEHDRRTALHLESRDFSHGATSLKWASDPEEKLFGMGQYQNGIFNLKGSFLELAQRNSQVSIPFLLSDRGYGFLWNHPGVGRATFGFNITEWQGMRAKEIDFWITAADTPAQIIANYTDATGKPPMMPDYGLGFWQSKLRYRSQEELLEVAREYHRRGIPLSVIVADYFHWPIEGSWCFDPDYWPDPSAMVKELSEMGIKLSVSLWPTVDLKAPAYQELRKRGLLAECENGQEFHMNMGYPTAFMDFTNPETRAYFWKVIEKNYLAHGITDFWLDVAEPEYSCYDFANYRYYSGNCAEVGNQYPRCYTQAVAEGLQSRGITPVNLVRCGWAGSQRYGALIWSGDIASTFDSFRRQVVCGLQMAVAGIPWWTTDIGGFFGGYTEDAEFRELLIRWFQYGTFCPVMRLHGDRRPHQKGVSKVGGGRVGTGAANEIWAFGEEAYPILEAHIRLRERLKPYLKKLMREAHEQGAPVMRPLYYEFPKDPVCWEIQDQFMLGESILAAPILEWGARGRRVYLPAGKNWYATVEKKEFSGGQWIEAEAPLDKMPVFLDADCDLKELF